MTTIDGGKTPTPSGQHSQNMPGIQTQGLGGNVGMEPPSPQQNAIHAPLPTRRMLSQLLRQWQQSFPQSTQSSTSQQPQQPSQTSPVKDPATAIAAIPETPKSTSSEFPPVTPQQTRTTPSRLVVSPQITSSTSPHLQITTPTHTRRASITTFLPPDALLMSPIPRARNPGGFRHNAAGDADEGTMQFGEVVGLVGGWEDKMRSATAWAVVNTTIPPVADEEMVEKDEEEMVEGTAEEGTREESS